MNSLEITTNIPCPNQCIYCPQDILQKQYNKCRYLTFDTFRICLSKLPPKLRLHFSGFSEPFNNPDCCHMIKYAYEQEFEVCLYSTLIGLTAEALNVIKDIQFHAISIHLPNDLMKFKITPKYNSILLSFIKIFPNAKRHIIGLSNILSNSINANIIPTINLHSRANNIIDEDIGIRRHPYTQGKIQCGIGNLKNNILLPNGDVYLCCMDFGLKHKLGNLVTDTYESLFKSDEYTNVIQGLSDESIDILCRFCSECQTGNK